MIDIGPNLLNLLQEIAGGIGALIALFIVAKYIL